MHLFSSAAARIADTLARDDSRVTLQTVSAVLVAYGAMHLLPFDTTTWAVFSALFVVQANIGGTIDLALWRIAGAFVGVLVAIPFMLVVSGNGNFSVAALAGSVLTMSLIALRWPMLSYGLVTTSVIAVAPSIQLIEGSFEKLMAIIVGSSSAILACMIVLPITAHRSANMQLAAALRMCGRYLMDCMNRITDEKAKNAQDTQDEIVTALRRASLKWEQAGIEKSTLSFRKPQQSAMSRELLQLVSQLQESLAVADRLSQSSARRCMAQPQIKAIQALAEVFREELDHLSEAIASGSNKTDMSKVWRHHEHLCMETDVVASKACSHEEREYFATLKWACHSIVSSIDSVAQYISTACKENSGK